MQKIFKIDNSKIYMAPVKLLEKYIFPEMEQHHGMRMQASGYKFLTCATSDGESDSVLDSIDFYMTGSNGDTMGYTLSVAHTLILNPVTMSQKIADEEKFRLSDIEKYKLCFMHSYYGTEITMSAKDFIDYALGKFYE